MVKVVDIIVSGIELSYSGSVDSKEMQDLVKKWLKKNGYNPAEKGFETKTLESGKTTVMRWEADKRVDDYHKLLIRPTISISNYREVKVEGKKITEGNVKIKLEGEIERDYEETWKGTPLKRFFRAFFDKFLASEKEDKVAKLIKKETGALADELKKYFAIE